MRHVLDRGEVSGGIALTDTAFVVAKDHVHHPMQAVLDGPVAANDWPNLLGRMRQGGDVEPCLPLGFVSGFARGFDHDDAFQPWPAVAFPQPANLMQDRIVSRFDAAVIAIHGFVAADPGVFEILGFLLGSEEFDVLAQGALIALLAARYLSAFERL